MTCGVGEVTDAAHYSLLADTQNTTHDTRLVTQFLLPTEIVAVHGNSPSSHYLKPSEIWAFIPETNVTIHC